MPPRSKIGGHIVFVLFVILSFILSYSVSAIVFIFHMNIPCDKNFPWEPLFFYPVTLTLEFDPYFLKTVKLHLAYVLRWNRGKNIYTFSYI